MSSASAAILAAAKKRDREALVEAARAHLRDRRDDITGPSEGSPFRERDLGALLLTGAASSAASGMNSRIYIMRRDGQRRALGGFSDADFPLLLLPALFHQRLLSGSNTELPRLGDAASWHALSPVRRKDLRLAQRYLAALRDRDAGALRLAINALGRSEGKTFSLLAYVLFAKARDAGFMMKIPRKYDF